VKPLCLYIIWIPILPLQDLKYGKKNTHQILDELTPSSMRAS
jgi:hypothetical protein